VGTTKLTRKEILGDDPIHDAIVNTIEVVRERGKYLALGAVAVVLAGFGIYLALQYMERRDDEAQRILTRGIDFYHAQVDASALDDPYGKGREPVFRNEEAQFQAASREFTTVNSRFGTSKLAIIARYYLGLCQMRLGQKEEAVKSLDAVSNNTKDRSIGFLGKRVLAKLYMETGNAKGAHELLDGMIKDPQCDIPKEELKLQLARALLSMGKKEDAIKTLKEAKTEAARSTFQSLIVQELSRLEETPGLAMENLKPVTIRP
jgi:predicted negative regulator of RcsB-dependent stress response